MLIRVQATTYLLGVIMLAVWVVCSWSVADDWPNWQGPSYNGISSEKGFDYRKLKNGKIRWQQNVGKGYSSVSVATLDGQIRLFTMGNVNDQDVVYCFDARGGKLLWKHSYREPAGKRYPGPRATPVVSGDYVFTCSQEGHVVCLDATRGKVVWQQDLLRVAKVKKPRWGFASSALVMGDAVIYNAGEYGVAFHRSSGKVLWKSTGLGAYATAIPYPAGSVPKSGTNGGVILFSAQGAVAVQYRGASAKVLWRLPLTNKYQVNAAVPIYVNDGLYISTGYGVGGLFASLKDPKPQKQWQNKNLRIHFSSPMAKDGYIYGVDGQAGRGNLVCLDARTGQLKWKANDTRFGTFITVGDKIIYLNDTGELFVIAVNPERYEKLISWKTPLGRTCWTRPIYANGMLYCRNDKGKLIAIDLH